jgi:hypothetical protein
MKISVGDTVIIKNDYYAPEHAGTSWKVELLSSQVPGCLESYMYVCHSLTKELLGQGHNAIQVREIYPERLKYENGYRYFSDKDIARVLPYNNANTLGNFPKKSKEEV